MIFGKFSGIIVLNSNMFWMWSSLCGVLCLFGHIGILLDCIRTCNSRLLTNDRRKGVPWQTLVRVWNLVWCNYGMKLGMLLRVQWSAERRWRHIHWTLEVLKMWNGLDLLEGGLQWAYEFDQRTDETDEDHFDEFWELKGVTHDDAFVVKGMPCQRNSSAVF